MDGLRVIEADLPSGSLGKSIHLEAWKSRRSQSRFDVFLRSGLPDQAFCLVVNQTDFEDPGPPVVTT